MSILASILGGPALTGAGGFIKQVGDTIGQFITTDEEQAAANLTQYQAETERMTLEDRGLERQAEINLEEAQHPSVFVAGWRSAAGWVCVSGLLYATIIYHFLLWIMPIVAPDVAPPPNIDVEYLEVLLWGMLGLGSVRGIEKIRGVARDRVLPKGAITQRIATAFKK